MYNAYYGKKLHNDDCKKIYNDTCHYTNCTIMISYRELHNNDAGHNNCIMIILCIMVFVLTTWNYDAVCHYRNHEDDIYHNDTFIISVAIIDL